MKKTRYISFISHAFMALVVMGAMAACVEPENFSDITKVVGAGRLSINPTVSEATIVTRSTPSDPALNEKKINTLDVFVEHVGDGTFMNQYHLVSTDAEPIYQTGDQIPQGVLWNLLAEYWTKEGLRYGEKYNIYVAVNNTQTKGPKDLSTFNVAKLKELVADEVTDGLAVVDEATNNIDWPRTTKWEHTPSGNIYKQYVSGENVASVTVEGNLYGFTTSKEFMMDGVLENWTPVAGSKDQIFKPVTLNRAAAKIVLNLKFDPDFIKSLTYYKKTEGSTTTWEEKPDAEKFSITGAPGWRFYNFAFGAQVFDPGTNYDPVEVHNSATLLRHPYNFDFSESAEQAAQIVTYTYPNKWKAADYSTKAPSLVISVPFLQNGQTEPEYHYYRIPLVEHTVTEVKRNHIYVINATIATRGSELHEDVDEIKDVIYEVLPWNDENNSAAIHDEVKSVQHYYFKVNPKVYTLRGDGDQDVVLTYLKAAGTKVNWKLFTYDENGNQTGVVANNADGATRAWFYNADGAFTTTYNDNESGMNWSNTGPTPMGVKIEQSTEGTSGSTGTVTVTSHALNNRAIKYIRLRVYLDEEATFKNGKETMYEDIIIRHFPTDNIQNIVGTWSSYHSASSGTQEVTLTTRSLAEAEAWKEQYGVNYTTQELPATDYISYAEYSDHAEETGYTMTGPTTVNQNAFQTAVQDNTNRRNANSQANAVADAGEGHTYYWGESPQKQNNWNNYDYYTGNTPYKYRRYYSASYTHTYTYTLYSMTVEMVSTGNWVDWDRDAGKTYYEENVKYTRGTIFTAKVYDDSRNRIYPIEPTGDIDYHYGWGGYYTFSYLTYDIAQYYTQGNYYVYNINNSIGRAGTMDLTNNHMYVIQISSTSNDYIIGRPILGTPNAYLSQDDVVSPAFMIASQLGAVTPTNNNQTAATHCSNYMEVAADGTRYTGWRLPTADEIRVITRYQNGTINGVTISNTDYQAMTPVLTGRTYWCLTGDEVNTGIGSDGPYLRCVRDLSAEEVDRLNGFDKIIERYRNQ